jgi:hypothetical protein
MVHMLTLSAADRGWSPCRFKAKTIKLAFAASLLSMPDNAAPSKFQPMGCFYCRTGKKSLPRRRKNNIQIHRQI